jgi:polyhydroxyalkanoate synthesis regulator phasin
MPGDELFKRYLEIGASVLGMSRERAESIVRDLVASGEVAKGQASKVADWLVERGRSGTEELAELVRREIRQQVAALGLATKDDVARLEAQMEEMRAAAPAAPLAAAPEPVAKAAARPRKAKAAPAGGPEASTGATKSAGISRAGSVRKRTGASSTATPDAVPPAGGAHSSKG